GTRAERAGCARPRAAPPRSARAATRARQPALSIRSSGTGCSASVRRRAPELAPLLNQGPQALTQCVWGKAAIDVPVERDRNQSALFRYDDRGSVALFGQPDRRAMPRAEIAAETRIHGQRQKAGRGRNSFLLQNDGAVMQRRPGTENRHEKVVGE